MRGARIHRRESATRTSESAPAAVPGAPPCVSLDLEVDRDGRLRALAAVRSDDGVVLTSAGGDPIAALARLDAFAEGAVALLGHNLIEFDLPRLKAARPGLRALALPAIDTLRLSPLAFPRNPYHHLVKHYRDGGLRRGRRNDPELDARLALKLFAAERAALAAAPADLLAAWHRLCTPDAAGADAALDAVFRALRRAERPSPAAARAAVGRRLEGVACSATALGRSVNGAYHGKESSNVN